jgi:hypothetical protein
VVKCAGCGSVLGVMETYNNAELQLRAVDRLGINLQ